MGARILRFSPSSSFRLHAAPPADSSKTILHRLINDLQILVNHPVALDVVAIVAHRLARKIQTRESRPPEVASRT